jgi:hypothetical protein
MEGAGVDVGGEACGVSDDSSWLDGSNCSLPDAQAEIINPIDIARERIR